MTGRPPSWCCQAARWVSCGCRRVWSVSPAGVVELAEQGLPWRGRVCAQVFEEACVDLGRALRAYQDGKRGRRRGRPPGFPRFKRKGQTRDSFRLRNKISKSGAATIRVGHPDRPRSITLPVLGTVAVIEDTRRLRRLLRPDPDGTVRARVWFATVARRRDRWTITLSVQAPDLHPARRHPQRDPDDHGGFVGLDRGLAAYLVAATADRVERARVPPPRPLARGLAALRRASRQVSRRRPGSHNRARAARRLNRVHGRIADQRGHLLHELSTRLVQTHDRLCVENLAVANLIRNRRLSRSIADAGWGQLHRLLSYKAGWYRTDLAVAPRLFASSQLCTGCGRRNQALSLAERTYRCDPARGGCGLSIDRDRNAAANLAAWAETEHRTTAQTPDPQAGGRDTNACGGTGAGHRTRGGETGPATPPGKKQEPCQAAPTA